jgi:hypothetical protein
VAGGHGEALGVSPSWHASTFKGRISHQAAASCDWTTAPRFWRGRPDLNRQLSGGRPYPVDLAIGDEY